MKLFLGGFFSIYWVLIAMAFYVYIFRDAFAGKDFPIFVAGTISGGCFLVCGLVVAFMVLKP